MQKNEFEITQADNRSKVNNVSVFALGKNFSPPYY